MPWVRGKILWATKPKGDSMNWTQGDLNALLKNLGGEEVARRIQRGDKFTLIFEKNNVTPTKPLLPHLHVRVDRTRTPEAMINATGRRKWYINWEILAKMPRDGFMEGKVWVFRLDYESTVDQLDLEYEARGLRPDPYSLAALHEKDLSFSDNLRTSTHWRDSEGSACYMLFGKSRGVFSDRGVRVGRHDGRWYRSRQFAGVR